MHIFSNLMEFSITTITSSTERTGMERGVNRAWTGREQGGNGDGTGRKRGGTGDKKGEVN